MNRNIYLISFLLIFLSIYFVFPIKISKFSINKKYDIDVPKEFEVGDIMYDNQQENKNTTNSQKQFTTNNKKDKTKNSKPTTTSKVTTKNTQCNNETLKKILKNVCLSFLIYKNY